MIDKILKVIFVTSALLSVLSILDVFVEILRMFLFKTTNWGNWRFCCQHKILRESMTLFYFFLRKTDKIKEWIRKLYWENEKKIVLDNNLKIKVWLYTTVHLNSIWI